MNRFTRVIGPIAIAVSMGSALGAGGGLVPSAFADGKAVLGCSPSYTLAPIGTSTGPINGIDYLSQSLVPTFFTQDSLLALLNSLDHNGDGFLCYKTPQGWAGPPATSGAQRAGFFNLVDDKVISS